MGLPKRTHEEYVAEVERLVGAEYTVMGAYVNTDTPIRMRHNSDACGYHEYAVRPFKFLSHGQRCSHPACRGPRTRAAWHAAVDMERFLKPSKTDERFRAEVLALVGAEYVFLDPYQTTEVKLRVRHELPGCGHEYSVRPDTFLSGGRRCPRCARLQLWHGGSRAVRRIEGWLSQAGYDFERETAFEGLLSRNLRPLYYDFLVHLRSGAKLLMEYDGIQHVKGWMGDPRTIQPSVDNDRRKDSYARRNGLLLARLTHRAETRLEEHLGELFDHVEGSTTIPQGSTPQAIGGGNGRDPPWILI